MFHPRASWQTLVSFAWVVLFLVVFLLQPLPNNQLARTDVVAAWWSGGVVARQPLVFELLDAVDPPREAGGPARGLVFLVQRVPLWSTAALIAGGAWGLGSVLLRSLPLPALDGWELGYARFLSGLCALSLITLGLGYAGGLSQPLIGGVLLVALASGCWGVWLQRGHAMGFKIPLPAGWFAFAPFVVALLLGSVTPPTDFDVKEYHLQGPKEWYQQGRISFLEHNVYTSFPFLSEMLLLAGMVVWGDWYWGGIVGQAVQMLFAPLTAWGLWILARRWNSSRAGGYAALLYLSTPWIYRTAIIPYAEGSWTAYGFAAFVAAHWLVDAHRFSASAQKGCMLLMGWLAGSAMACKYPGLLTAVLPLGLWLAGDQWRRHHSLGSSALAIVVYLSGVLAAVGPWLLKNLVETGNPVYPLAYSLLGGCDLDDRWAQQWQHAHPSEGLASLSLRDLLWKAFDIAAVNDWQSPLLFALAPVALGIWSDSRGKLASATSMLLWNFGMWWLLMHHIDRFWVPLLPYAALLAGYGATLCETLWNKAVLYALITLGCLYNLTFCMTGLGGFNAGLMDLHHARQIAAGTSPAIAWLNVALRRGELPANLKVLCVGEAQVFDAEFPCVYNTVFDRSWFETWCALHSGQQTESRLREPEEIRQTLRSQGITHILVNWGEVLRYRQTYGYTDFVHPRQFRTLEIDRVLEPPLNLPADLGRRSLERMSPAEVQSLEEWAPELIASCEEQRCFLTWQVFPVRWETLQNE